MDAFNDNVHSWMRPSYHDVSRFPELASIAPNWRAIRDEAELALETLGRELGDAATGSWILPLLPEDEDAPSFGEDVYRKARGLSPITAGILDTVPYAIALAFSKLKAGQHIQTHTHRNPYLTGLLCLQGGEGSVITVGNEPHQFVDGEIVVFDYRLPHSVKNTGDVDRLALLVLIDPR